jgi:aspartyl-tRNA(Asn)/glutamyl-tRNA(Gln) amidotransferase subunit C
MVTREQVLHVARLAKLTLTPEEEERFCAQLGRILDYVQQLREIDEKADELTHVLPAEKDLRADKLAPSLPRPEVLALAPASDDETMKVPAVIEGGGGA